MTVRDQFRGLDVNRDGRISRDEFLGPEPRFRAMDRDNDGLHYLGGILAGYEQDSKITPRGGEGTRVGTPLSVDFRRVRT